MMIKDAQQEMRRAYVGGGPGVVISGLVWLVTAAVQYTQGTQPAFVILFLGGMVIFPCSKLVCRFGFRRDNEAADNPLGMTALESTIAMIGGLFAAWLFLSSSPALVLPLCAIAVGTHYFVFKTVYGDRTYWLLGVVITGIGLADIYVVPMHRYAAPLVGITELLVGVFLALRASRSQRFAMSPSADG